ncbi:MAG: tRNA pseudouridine(38-40) synthase TruA [Oceanospirillaceae bacterium]|nr:tRNA pseudouridine(38-40) synthase TruA [Oceanospirillaceae bacterium]
MLPEGHHRVALGVAYNGRHYHGWQRQPHGHISVQEKLEDALTKVADQPIKVMCAGRTDSGVHASAQVVHFDTSAIRPLRAWTHGGNMNLPDDIAIQWAHPVSVDFHARFSATARRYRYVIYNHPMRPALMDKEVSWNYRPLDVEAMQQAANHLVGKHDFSSFRAAACQANTPVRTIHHLEVIKAGDYIVLDVRANAFLHHMIRNLAGLLMKVGAGDAPSGWALEVLTAKDRRASAATAPPYGLYFVNAEYDTVFGLPEQLMGPHFLSPWMNP